MAVATSVKRSTDPARLRIWLKAGADIDARLTWDGGEKGYESQDWVDEIKRKLTEPKLQDP